MGDFLDDVGDVFGDIGNWFEDEVWEPVVEGSKQIGEYLGYGTTSKKTVRQQTHRRVQAQEQSESAARKARGPIVDDATRNQLESDRLRRRRGVLANVYAGANSPNPYVGTAQLLGQ